MVEGEQVDGRADAAARAAGIHRRPRLTLSDVDKRRTQLFSVSLFVVAAIIVTVATLLVSREFLPESLRLEEMDAWVPVALGGALALAFMAYVFEKERSLRNLTNLLIEERVYSAALTARLTEISAMVEVAKALNTTLDPESLFHTILSAASIQLGATEGSILLLSEDKTYLEVVSHRGSRVEDMNGTRIQVGMGLAGGVAERLEPTIVNDSEVAGWGSGPVHSAMCVPLINRGDVMGVLLLIETQGRREFTDHDLSVLGLFAEHAAIAIGNARLFEQERETIARLEELDRLKSDFVATVSHELKTPLTGIIGAAKTLLRKGQELDPEQHSSFVEMIERQGNRLYRLVEDILTTAQIESGAPRSKRLEIDLRNLAEIVIEDLQQTKVGTGRNIELTTSPEHPRVWGDPTAIQQILLNLVENALKYSEESSSVRVTVKESRTEAVLEVSDEGEGVSQEELKTIFERFSQVDSASTRSVGGFGLGLYIVKSLVEAHQGTIDVESVTGRGSTFRVRLPKRAEDRV